MEAADSKALKNRDSAPAQEQLSQLFGSYKAEWLEEHIYDLFTEPAYFPELMTPRPCMIIGGRGTGKTTVLRCLSYEGQFALAGRNLEAIRSATFFGFYHRVNTNRVTAFRGPELPERQWVHLFAHYFNLIMCEQVLKFIAWYEMHTGVQVNLGGTACRRIATSLHLRDCSTVRELADDLDDARVSFEAYVNNVADGDRPPLSMQGAPIDTLFEELSALSEFKGKHFFFLLDEYENFEDYQQTIVNSLIKHAAALYTFKVGVRELGLRRRTTLNPNEQLISPADYVRINIAEKLSGKRFREFARNVCNSRIERLKVENGEVIRDIVAVLPGLTEDDEAERLGVREQVSRLKLALAAGVSAEEVLVLDQMPPLKAYLVKAWAEINNEDVRETFRQLIANPKEWDMRYTNYKHALLYTVKRGKRGIRKYYCGWNVFAQLAASNIRYVLELVEQSLLWHLSEDGRLSEPVPVERQTKAAQWVGRKNLSELEGLSVYGAQLTKLVLSFGRIFQVMTEQPFGHAPEVNQFHLGEEEEPANLREEADRLLNSAVMHLALLRFSGSKPGDEGDTRDYDYMLHPIFCPFFVFSHRLKRKMLISASELLGLVRRPRDTIREVLSRHNRVIDDDELSEQLVLFSGFYRGS